MHRHILFYMLAHQIYKYRAILISRLHETNNRKTQLPLRNGNAINRWRTGVGVTKSNSTVPLFSPFFNIIKHWFPIEYHVHIWQVPLQLSTGDTRQIWKWLRAPNIWLCKKILNGTNNKRNFSNPPPKYVVLIRRHYINCRRNIATITMTT